jgi:hypothetical protein
MTSSFPSPSQRRVMQRLRTDIWRMQATVDVVILNRLVANGWVERRGEELASELRLTLAGLEALRGKMQLS